MLEHHASAWSKALLSTGLVDRSTVTYLLSHLFDSLSELMMYKGLPIQFVDSPRSVYTAIIEDYQAGRNAIHEFWAADEKSQTPSAIEMLQRKNHLPFPLTDFARLEAGRIAAANRYNQNDLSVRLIRRNISSLEMVHQQAISGRQNGQPIVNEMLRRGYLFSPYYFSVPLAIFQYCHWKPHFTANIGDDGLPVEANLISDIDYFSISAWHMRGMSGEQPAELRRWTVSYRVMDILTMLCAHAGWIGFGHHAIYVSERPSALHWNPDPRHSEELHREDGPAIEFPDGAEIYALEGIYMPKYVFDGSMTAQHILDERNMERRRILLKRFGNARFMAESNATPIHRDEYGELYHVRFNDDQPLCMVKVYNSTPLPDGTREVYWLTVPPEMERAKQAVAWSFGLSEAQYDPKFES